MKGAVQGVATATAGIIVGGITSNKAQTTRHRITGVRTVDEAQFVFVDTPGIHKPRTLLGERLNDAADAAAAIVRQVSGRDADRKLIEDAVKG